MAPARSDLLQGTLDVLVLKTLSNGPMHGWGISQRIQQVSDDVLAVNPTTLASRRADWIKLIKLWDRVVHEIGDPKTQDEAVKIMAARVGLEPDAYKKLLKGTHLLDLAAGKKAFKKADGLTSLYGSSKIADDFNVKNDVYKQHQDIDSYIDPSLTEAAK